MKLAAWTLSILMLGTLVPLLNTDAFTSSGTKEMYIEIPYTFEPPVLDGSIGDLEWQTQFTTNYFDAFDGTSFREIYPADGSDEEFTDQADLAVTFYLVYDDTYLYFAANVTDQSIVVDSGATYWRDDGVELLIDGAHDMDWDQRAGDPWPGFQDGTTFLVEADGSFFHDYSNGTPYERYFGEDKDWYGAARTVPSRNYYIVEMRVRLDSIASPTANRTIGLNIGVNDDDTGGLSKTALKWTGRDAGPGENPTFKNETHWGTAYLKPYVVANLPERFEVNEDEEMVISSNLSSGNHPDFGTGANFTWDLPLYMDGEWNNLTAYGPEFVHTFPEPLSFYTLILWVTDPSGISDKAVTRIYVSDVTPPLLEYSDAAALEEKPFTYVINATDNVGVSHINWSIFDSEWYNFTSFSPIFDHTFQHPGNYTITFTAFDEANNSAFGSARISVFDDVPPVIEGPVPDIYINTSEVLNLTAPYAYDDTEDGPDTNLSYSWSFDGDFGLFSFEGRTAGISIDIPGQYNGTLTVTDRIGLSSHLNFKATVHDDTPPFPVFFLPLEVPEKEELELNASSTFDNDPFFWNFSSFTWSVEVRGKGVYNDTLEGPVNTISFPFPGTATVTLTVMDPYGNVANLSKNTSVLDRTPPSAQFTLAKDIVDQGESFYLNINGSSDNLGLLAAHYKVFSITDGNGTEVMSTPFFGIRLANVTPDEFIYVPGLWISLAESGYYRIDLTLQDVSGFNDTISAFITVRDSIFPEARINRTLVYIELGQLVYLSASDSSDDKGPLSYTWFLKNGTELKQLSTGSEMIWAPPSTGDYELLLRVNDTGGNTDDAVCRVNVSEPSITGGGESSDYTLLYIVWGAAIAVILIGILALLIWARRRKAEEIAAIKEE